MAGYHFDWGYIDTIVHYADPVPTLFEAVGGDAVGLQVDGRSFWVIRGAANPSTLLLWAHNNVPEGPPT